MARRDWLKDCLRDCADKGGQLSAQELKEAFCDFCTQPECTRSLFGTSKFEQRVSTWKERLFTQVPRMPPSDPRFASIASKGFVIIPPEALVSPRASSEWLDPRDVASTLVSVPGEVESAPVSDEPTEGESPKSISPSPTPTPAPSQEDQKPVSREPALINTPYQGGIMLPGGRQPAPRPQRDSWDAPQPVRPGERVVKRGATIQFGVTGSAAPKDEGESK